MSVGLLFTFALYIKKLNKKNGYAFRLYGVRIRCPILGTNGLILDEELQGGHNFAAQLKTSKQVKNKSLFDMKYQPEPA